MFVCICNRLREAEIRSLAEEGMSFEDIQALTNLSSVCGSCREFAEELVSGARHIPAVGGHLPVVRRL